MIVLLFLIWLTNFAFFKDCALNIELIYDKDCDVIELYIKECEFSARFGFDSWNFSSAAGWLNVEDRMTFQVNDQVLKQDLKVM